MNNEGEKESSLRHLPPGKLNDIRQMFEGTTTRTKPLINKPRPATTLFSPPSETQNERKDTRRPATTLFTDAGTVMQEKERIPPKIRCPKPFRVSDHPRPKSELCKPAISQALQQINRNVPTFDKGSPKKQVPKPSERSPNKQALLPSGKSCNDEKEVTKSVERSSLKPILPTKPAQNVNQINKVTIETKHNEQEKTENPLLNNSRSERPVSVLQRTKMFENIESTDPSVSPVHTLRKKSGDGPMMTGIENNSSENPYCAPWDSKLRVSKQPIVLKLPKSPPPKKPPRTGAHDEYMQTKVFQKTDSLQTQNQDSKDYVLYDTVPDEDNDTKEQVEPVYRRIQKIQSAPAISPEKRRSSEDGDKTRPGKPQRPPPPKPRPASISSDECNENRQTYSISTLKRQHVKKKAHFDLDLDEVKFWDLPQDRLQRNKELRRSLSAECIATDISGDPVYIDPVNVVNFRDDTGSPIGYEVYVDSTGLVVTIETILLAYVITIPDAKKGGFVLEILALCNYVY
ncbi:hypothetical protein KUTeg_023780 [Tegillarca granosa]|uniref:Uncharacterized protein n=1 Tax=Tegillarca granosa TaxID=220873 RepID=A0ABQ9E3K3_TEGGR|nr:hypothetical protein KUTeg_023780 [Tegillarca granosa]